MTAPADPNAIRSYHAHVYFGTPAEREHALQLRTWIGERFDVQLGRIHDVLVGPHTRPMYQVAFAREVFAQLVPWLSLNHADLSVLVHPNTGRALDDHVIHALWLGARLPVREDVLNNDPDDDVIPVAP